MQPNQGTEVGAAIQRELAFASERELAAWRRAEELATANQALQEITDAVCRVQALDEVVPAVLEIAARYLDVRAAFYFEHPPGLLVRLRYAWLPDGFLLRPGALEALDPTGNQAVLRSLAVGLQVPDNYLGSPVDKQSRAVVVDHRAGTLRPDFDRLAIVRGWENELYVPLVAGNNAIGALVLNRGAEQPYVPAEIDLAETMAKHFALAVEMARLADRGREAAVLRAEQLAAQARAARLASSNRVLQQAVNATSSIKTLDELVPKILRLACNAFGAVGASFFEVGEDHLVRLLYWDERGVTLNATELLHSNEVGEITTRMLAEGFYSPPGYVDATSLGVTILDHRAGTGQAHFDDFCMRRGFELEMNVGAGAGRRSSTLCVFRGSIEPFTDADIALGQALASQLGVALERDTAQQRAEALERGNQALQQVANEVANAREMDEIIPKVLQVIASTFGASAAGYFNVSPDDTVHLRHWLIDGHGYTAAALLALQLGQHDPPKRLMAGVTVPPNYLGALPSHNLHSRFIDHVAGTSEPASDEWAVQEGWGMELNVPLVLNDRSVGAVTLYRANHLPYEASELQLAEQLVKQLTLAEQFVQFSDQVRELAISRERETAAAQRAQELVETNERLRENVIQLSEAGDLKHRLGQVLDSVCQQLRAAGACIFLHDPEKQTLEIVASADVTGESEMIPAIKLPARCTASFPASELPLWKSFHEQPTPIIVDVRLLEDATRIRKAAVQWHIDQNRPVLLALPLVVQRRLLGYLSVTFPDLKNKEDIDPDAIRIGESLAALIAMMIETRRLSKREQDAAVAEEKNRLALELHDTLAGAFTGIFMQLQAANDLPADENGRRQASIRKAEDLARNGLRQVRQFVHTLSFSTANPREMIVQMRELVQNASNDHSLRTEFTVFGRERSLKGLAAHAFLLVLQEAVANAQRYSSATTLRVSFTFAQNGANLTVRDDGRGFSLNEVRDVGFGLAGMEARMKRAGGTFQVKAAPGAGTTIVAEMADCFEAES